MLSANRRISGSCSGDEHLLSLSDDGGDTTERLRTEYGPGNISETSAMRVQQFEEDSDQTFDEMQVVDQDNNQELMSLNNLQSSASRPSIDQMLPTRHSQLELSS